MRSAESTACTLMGEGSPSLSRVLFASDPSCGSVDGGCGCKMSECESVSGRTKRLDPIRIVQVIICHVSHTHLGLHRGLRYVEKM